jgi:NhaP-type Na+/H+ or K+/H+ antiporter
MISNTNKYSFVGLLLLLLLINTTQALPTTTTTTTTTTNTASGGASSPSPATSINVDLNSTTNISSALLHDSSHHHTNVFLPLYFLFTALTLGACSLQIQNRYLWFIPYTVFLFLEGLAMGVANESSRFYLLANQSDVEFKTAHPFGTEDSNGLRDLSLSIDQWTSIDGHLLAAIFLPALIFSDAMRVDVHLFRKIFWQSFLMATIGVGLQTITVASVAKEFYGPLGYNWSWYLSLTFGAVLGATDPIAVVAMLESVQAPAKLTTLMSGESHISDLTALVLFNVFLNLLSHPTIASDPNFTADTTSYVATMVFGGPAFGALLGFFALWWIQRNKAKERKEDIMIQVTITVVLAYLTFILSENNLDGNGVLATVTAAVIIAAYAWPAFSSPETIGNVWKAIEYFGSTLIFTLAGCVYGKVVYVYKDTYIPPSLYGHALLTWIFVYIIRTAIVLVLFPLLHKMGYGLSWQEAITVTWGGLKGAVAMALGLVVFNSNTYNDVDPSDSVRDRVQFIFLVGTVVFMSVLVNSATAPLIMRLTGILSRSQVQKMLLEGVEKRIRDRAFKAFEEITKSDVNKETGSDNEFKSVTLNQVRTVVSAFQDVKEGGRASMVGGVDANNSPRGAALLAQRFDQFASQIALQGKANDMIEKYGKKANRESVAGVRELFLDIVKATYWEMIKAGTLPANSSATRTLLQSCDIAKDQTDEDNGMKSLSDFDCLGLPNTEEADAQALHVVIFEKIDKCLPDCVTIDDQIGDWIHSNLRHDAVYAASSFITAHEIAQRKVKEYVGEDDDVNNEDDSPEEFIVVQESKEAVKRAREYMERAERRDRGIVELVRAKKVASMVLTIQDNLIQELEDQGICDEHTTEELRSVIHSDFRKVEKLDAISSGSSSHNNGQHQVAPTV